MQTVILPTSIREQMNQVGMKSCYTFDCIVVFLHRVLSGSDISQCFKNDL